MARIIDLPNELLIIIAKYLQRDEDIKSLSALNQAHSRLHAVADSILYDVDAVREHALALIWAAEHGHLAAAQKALDAGTDVNYVHDHAIRLFEGNHLIHHTSCQRSPLTLAVHFGHEDLVRLLIDAGADVEQTSRRLCDCGRRMPGRFYSVGFWWTPLHGAICQGHSNIAKLLLAAGASIYVDDGRTNGPTAMVSDASPIEISLWFNQCKAYA